MYQAKIKRRGDNVALTSLSFNRFYSSLYQIDRENATESTGIVQFAFGRISKKLSTKYIGTFVKTHVLHIHL